MISDIEDKNYIAPIEILELIREYYWYRPQDEGQKGMSNLYYITLVICIIMMVFYIIAVYLLYVD